jgi:energy-coupling factor transport system substrate-specific component
LLEKIRKDFGLTTWILIPIAIVMNGALGWIVAKLDLPAYLDTIGTVFIAVVAGPWVGALAGVLNNLILGIFSPNFIPYWSVAMFIGLVAGFCANAGMFKIWWKVVLAGIFIAITASLLSALVAMKLYGEITSSALYFLIQEPVDKITTAMIVFVMIQVLPKRILALLPRPENIVNGESTNHTQLYMAIGIVILLALFITFVLGKILGG